MSAERAEGKDAARLGRRGGRHAQAEGGGGGRQGGGGKGSVQPLGQDSQRPQGDEHKQGADASRQADRCDEQAQSLTCFSVCLCDEQTQLEAVVDTFKNELGGLIVAEVHTSFGLEEDEQPDTSQVASMQAAKDKRTAAAMKHLNVVKNGSYGFLQWEEGYTRTAHEEEAWKDA
jgi:hypothetical protein